MKVRPPSATGVARGVAVPALALQSGAYAAADEVPAKLSQRLEPVHPAVKAKFASYPPPVRRKLLALRQLILRTASTLPWQHVVIFRKK